MATFATSRLFTIFLLLLAANAVYAHRTTVRGDSCEEEIENNDLSQCKSFISGQGNPFGCCGELGNVQYSCACDALKHILKEIDGGTDEINRAYSLRPYCRMPFPCDLGGRTTATKFQAITVRADSCEEDIEKSDLSQCKSFISGQGNPLGCCGELGGVPFDCGCDALKHIIKEIDGGTDEINRAYSLRPYCRMPFPCDLGGRRTTASKFQAITGYFV